MQTWELKLNSYFNLTNLNKNTQIFYEVSNALQIGNIQYGS